jgi:hypothetical protein
MQIAAEHGKGPLSPLLSFRFLAIFFPAVTFPSFLSCRFFPAVSSLAS